MRKPSKPLVISLAVGLTLCAIPACCLFSYFGPAWSSLWSAMRQESRNNQKANYEPAALDMARLCQSDPTFFKTQSIYNTPWLPQTIRKLQPSSVSIEPDNAVVGCGGGFYHYGFRLMLDKAFTSPTLNQWHLFRIHESGDSGPIMTFTLDKSDSFPIEQLKHTDDLSATTQTSPASP